MIFWIDAQLSPQIAEWIRLNFEVEALALRDINLHRATDLEIFQQAKNRNAVLITKDIDFKNLLEKYSFPPKII